MVKTNEQHMLNVLEGWCNRRWPTAMHTTEFEKITVTEGSVYGTEKMGEVRI